MVPGMAEDNGPGAAKTLAKTATKHAAKKGAQSAVAAVLSNPVGLVVVAVVLLLLSSLIVVPLIAASSISGVAASQNQNKENMAAAAMDTSSKDYSTAMQPAAVNNGLDWTILQAALRSSGWAASDPVKDAPLLDAYAYQIVTSGRDYAAKHPGFDPNVNIAAGGVADDKGTISWTDEKAHRDSVVTPWSAALSTVPTVAVYKERFDKAPGATSRAKAEAVAADLRKNPVAAGAVPAPAPVPIPLFPIDSTSAAPAAAPAAADSTYTGPGGKAAAKALSMVGQFGWYHRCLASVNAAWSFSVGYLGASTAWNAWLQSDPADRHPMSETPTLGAAIYFPPTPGNSAGHVVTYVGNGKVVSNDIVSAGLLSEVPLSDVTGGRWRLHAAGWTNSDHSAPTVGTVPGATSDPSTGGATTAQTPTSGVLDGTSVITMAVGWRLGVKTALCTVADTAPVAVAAPAAGTVQNAPTTATGASVSVPDAGGHMYTLDARQLKNLATVNAVIQAHADEIGSPADVTKAMVIADATILVETTGYNEASRAVPESLNYPHDNVTGGDYDSAGLFQQRVRMGAYGTAKDIMDPVMTTVMWLGLKKVPNPAVKAHTPGLLDIKDWKTREPGLVAQKVQVSAFPDRYTKLVPYMPAVIKAASGITVDLATLGSPAATAGCPAVNGAAAVGSIAAGDTYLPYWKSKGGAPGMDMGEDEWAFYWGECTSFAAWSVRTRTGYSDFVNNYKGAHFGNAREWKAAADQLAIPNGPTPEVGAVAVRTYSSNGHVAFVTAVNADGTINIAEYNHVAHHTYSERKNVKYTERNGDGFDNFIYFGRKAKA